MMHLRKRAGESRRAMSEGRKMKEPASANPDRFALAGSLFAGSPALCGLPVA
jgi:hypothetical protein